MNEPLIPGGCILLARKIIESAIWDKPPLYIKVWVYLLVKAQHSEYKKLKRGQLITSIPEIINDVSWRVGARLEKPTKDQVFQIIDWLRSTSSKATLRGYESNAKATPEATPKATMKATMITTSKATQKILINICNYSDYQELRSYESNAESNNESNGVGNDESYAEKATGEPTSASEPDNINKNVSTNNNNKNKDKDIKTSSRQKKEYAEDSVPYKMAKYLHQKIMDHAEDSGVGHLVNKSNLQTWADDCRKLLEIDEIEKALIKDVIDWATSDIFWKKNILSASKLRGQFKELAIKMNFEKKGSDNKNGRHEQGDKGIYGEPSGQSLTEMFTRRA